jgi:ABC-type nitrate/sulfonate/bicarbonate transport system substrate-binding protein
VVGRRALLTTGAAAGAALAIPRRVGGQVRGRVRLAYLQLGWAACEIIHKADLLGRRGWAAEYTAVPGSPAGLVNAFASKTVDAIDMGFAMTAKMFEDGVPLRVTGVATALLGAIVRHREAPIRSIEDLRGRKVAAVVGSSTFLDIRALIQRGYRFDIQQETKLVTAASPPDLANLLARRDVEAIIAWQPVSDLAVQKGFGAYLAKQIDLWRAATGRRHDFPVHVCYLADPGFLETHRAFAADLNLAQKDAVDIWYREPERAIGIVAEVTKIERAVVEVAHRETVRMLHGLTPEQVETLIVQLGIMKESGFLGSGLWSQPDRIRREFFWQA